MNLFELYAVLSLDNQGYKDSLNESESVTQSVGSKIQSVLGKLVTLEAIEKAGSALVSLTKTCVENYGEYEQLVGGVETLFGAGGQSLEEYAKSAGKATDEVKSEYDALISAQDAVIANANEAYKTAQISANDYMETVTSFSASLLQSLDGDTTKSAEYADRAIVDMADNANKMGTAMESIQNAYQGFAKQNYTMLDNLKLGYGGTKEEMQRLISDASKMTDVQKELGVTVDASSLSFANIVNAISVMQENMGIAGTSAKEATTTIQGSFTMLQSAWTNLATAMADPSADIGTALNQVIESATAFAGNVVPAIASAVPAIVSGLTSLFDTAVTELPGLISSILPTILTSVQTLVLNIVDRLPEALKTILGVLPSILQTVASTIVEAIPMLIESLTEMLPTLTESLADICNQLADGLPEQLPVFIENILTLIQGLADSLAENASILIEAGLQLIMALAEGLINALPTLIEQVPTIITTLANIINDNAPKILQAGIQLIVMLAKGIVEAIPTLVENIPQIIEAIVAVWSAMDWISLGKNAIKGMKDGVLNMVEEVRTAGGTIKDTIVNVLQALPSKLLEIGKGGIKGMINGFKNMLSSLVGTAGSLMAQLVTKFKSFSLVDVGKNLIQGLINGVGSMAGALLNYMGNLMSSAIDKVKGIFGVHSPSKVFAQIGEYLVDGFNVGLDTLDVDKSTSGFNDVIDNISDLQSGRMTVATASLIGQQVEESGSISSDALTAILDKLDSLGKMQIVLDTGAFVGQTVNAYDTALGKLYTKQARYV